MSNKQQFKTDDFVRYKHIQNGKALRINNINCGYCYMINSEEAFKEHELVKWQPQVGELCWFTENPDDVSLATLGYFEEINKWNHYIDTRGYSWEYCEPFLNSKPSWFKD